MRRTLGALQQGQYDPCVRWEGEVFWRATRTPEGSVTTRVEKLSDRVRMNAWGAGAQWATQHLADLVGEGQDDSPFGHEFLDEALRRHAGVRMPKSRAVFEALTFSIIGQRVTQMEAKASWRKLVWRFNEVAPAAPGPKLYLPPSAEQISGIGSWAFHQYGVERKRAHALILAAKCVRRLEEACSLPPAEAKLRLMAIPGVGVWTAAEVALVALGDVDAVSAGDFHLKNQVGWALAGNPRSTDEEMLELLEPFAPRRGLAARLIVISGSRAPKYGPRYSPLPIAAI